jgi:dolichyl-diphosphooligosaccharide--protein glycosyltransferase
MNLAELEERYGKYRNLPLLIGIFLLGFSIRYLAKGPRIGPELDTWFHYRMVNYILDLGYVPRIDPLAYYPTGRPVWEIDPLGLPYFIAYSYKLITFTGITLMDYMVSFPAIFTSLAAVPLFLLTKELFDERIGLLTALFWQIVPSTLTRTHAGFVDKETLASVYIFLWLWLFIKSLKTFSIKDTKTVITPIFAGIFMGLSTWTWGGTSYFILVISTSIFLYTLVNLGNLRDLWGYTLILMTAFGALTMKLIQSPRHPFTLFYKTNFIYMSLTGLSLLYGFVIAYNYLKVKIGGKNSKKAIYSAIALFIGGAWVSGFLMGLLRGINDLADEKILLKKSLVAGTVSENLAPNFPADWISHFSVLLYVAPLGILLLIYQYKLRKEFSSLFILVFALSGMLGMRSDIRLSFVLTPAFAVLTSYTVFYFINHFQEKEVKLEKILATSKKQKVRYKAETSLSNTKVATFLVLIVLFGIVASPVVSGFSMLNGRSVDVPQPWYNAMMWIKENTPEDSVIVSWWDYGYWEQALGKRRSVGDGGNAGPLVYNSTYTEGLEYRGSNHTRNVDLAKMFTSPEDEALKYLRPYVDYENVPTYVLVSYEEFGKSGAINTISQGGNLFIFPQTYPKSDNPQEDLEKINEAITTNNIEAYSPVINMGGYWQIWVTGFIPTQGVFTPNPEMKEKLLPKLLPMSTGFGQGLEHFEMVYPENPEYLPYVLIYKII